MDFSRLIVLTALLLSWPAMAAKAVDPVVADAITVRVQDILDGQEVELIESTPVAGIYLVKVKGNDVFYTDEKANHLFLGRLYSMGEEGLEDLTEQKQSHFRELALKELDPASTIAFKPEGKAKAVINVFTDIDCGYCRLLHKQVPELNSKGVEVRYLAYPRAGLQSESYRKLVSAWCADNPQQALTDLKNDKSVPYKACDNPVAEQFELGGEFGVRGTPALVLMDGTMIPGYKPAAELLEILGVE